MILLERQPVAPTRLLTKGRSRANQDRDAYDANTVEYLSGEYTFLFDQKIYAADAVKKALAKMQYCKCCYCERKLPPTQLAVEHFRPKGGVQQSVDRKMEKPGYFWLAYRWDNLLLACNRCNSRNKGNQFPLQNPTKRARPPHYKVEEEKPLFIDPASQDPRQHIRFDGATPVDRTKKGRETIKGLGLTKADLREKRIELLLLIDTSIVAVEEASKQPDDKELQKKASEAREFLDLAVKPQSEFSSMAIDYLARFEI